MSTKIVKVESYEIKPFSLSIAAMLVKFLLHTDKVLTKHDSVAATGIQAVRRQMHKVTTLQILQS